MGDEEAEDPRVATVVGVLEAYARGDLAHHRHLVSDAIERVLEDEPPVDDHVDLVGTGVDGAADVEQAGVEGRRPCRKVSGHRGHLDVRAFEVPLGRGDVVREHDHGRDAVLGGPFAQPHDVLGGLVAAQTCQVEAPDRDGRVVHHAIVPIR